MRYYHCREIGGMRSSCRFTLVGGDKAMRLIKLDKQSQPKSSFHDKNNYQIM